MNEDTDHFRDVVAEVAAAYFSNTHVSASDIPQVISQIASSLAAVGGARTQAEEPPAAEEAPEAQPKLTPAQIRRSIKPEALISFEDGKPYKTLRRHLTTRGLTPEQYREKWGLPGDYPMVSADYSAARSQMAKSLGLGQMGRGRVAPSQAEGVVAAPKAARKPRAKKA